MLLEVTTAAEFFCRFLSHAGFPVEHIQMFKACLIKLMCCKFESHWNPSDPCGGNAYRALSCFDGKLDPIILRAASTSGILSHDACALFSDSWNRQATYSFNPNNASPVSEKYLPKYSVPNAPQYMSNKGDKVMLGKKMARITLNNFHSFFPSDLVVWVDPGCVSYRINDFGSITTIYENRRAVTLKRDDRSIKHTGSTGKSYVMAR
jgi:hypothetical protein